MVYVLNGVIAKGDVLDAGIICDPQAELLDRNVIALNQGVELLVITDALLADITGTALPGRQNPTTTNPFARELPPELRRKLVSWSRRGPVAYVEADFWAGDGHQSAAVWHKGAVTLGPVTEARFAGPRERWPINAALAALGVGCSSSVTLSCGHPVFEPIDLFEAVGLGRERHPDDWLAGTGAKTPTRVRCERCDGIEHQVRLEIYRRLKNDHEPHTAFALAREVSDPGLRPPATAAQVTARGAVDPSATVDVYLITALRRLAASLDEMGQPAAAEKATAEAADIERRLTAEHPALLGTETDPDDPVASNDPDDEDRQIR